MAKLTSDFPLLPDDAAPDRYLVYAFVYEQLTSLGLPVPTTPAAAITRAELLAHLQKEAGKLLKEELKKTVKPDYSGKTDQEQTDLFNAYHDEHGSPPPVSYVLVKFPFAPNLLTLDDIKESKKNGN